MGARYCCVACKRAAVRPLPCGRLHHGRRGEGRGAGFSVRPVSLTFAIMDSA